MNDPAGYTWWANYGYNYGYAKQTAILQNGNGVDGRAVSLITYNAEGRAVSNPPTGSLTIPTVVTMGNEAFSVVEIGKSALKDCSGVTSVTIPESDALVKINSSAFYGCTGIAKLTVPRNIQAIGSYAFYGCTSLASVEINGPIAYIADHAFDGCTSLSDFAIPNTVTSIGAYAFCLCRSLDSLTISGKVSAIGDGAFEDCAGLVSLKLPDSVTAIGASAFRGCTSLKAINLGRSVTQIGGSAFMGCTDLRVIVIPASVTSMNSQAPFNGCASLEKVYLPEIIRNSFTAGQYRNFIQGFTGELVWYDPETTIVLPTEDGSAVVISKSWFSGKCAELLAEHGGDHVATALADAANGYKVLECYVAGIDPTDPDDKFTASITFDAQGKPVISHSPELSAEEAAKRTYRKFGKVKLNDANWTEIAAGEEENYSFFKVTVEMK